MATARLIRRIRVVPSLATLIACACLTFIVNEALYVNPIWPFPNLANGADDKLPMLEISSWCRQRPRKGTQISLRTEIDGNPADYEWLSPSPSHDVLPISNIETVIRDGLISSGFAVLDGPWDGLTFAADASVHEHRLLVSVGVEPDRRFLHLHGATTRLLGNLIDGPIDKSDLNGGGAFLELREFNKSGKLWHVSVIWAGQHNITAASVATMFATAVAWIGRPTPNEEWASIRASR